MEQHLTKCEAIQIIRQVRKNRKLRWSDVAHLTGFTEGSIKRIGGTSWDRVSARTVKRVFDILVGGNLFVVRERRPWTESLPKVEPKPRRRHIPWALVVSILIVCAIYIFLFSVL